MPTPAFLIKVPVHTPRAATFRFEAQKTMYGAKKIAVGDTIFIFDSENEGGSGLLARGVVTAVAPTPREPGGARQTPRVSLTVKRTALAKRHYGRAELKTFSQWDDDRPETELNFKFYRQATDKIGGITEAAATLLNGFF